MEDAFATLAARHDLEDREGTSPGGLRERNLYSRDMAYRYAFARWWGPTDLATTDVWVLLNPATGDTELRRRPTLERCMTRSRSAGRSGVLIVNLFGHRHTNPKTLVTTIDPVGPANDDALRLLRRAAPRTIAAWGSGGRFLGRSRVVAPLLDRPFCLGTTRHGEPRHPLYVAAAAPVIPWPAADGDPPGPPTKR